MSENSKVALIVGAGDYIGRAVAEKFAAEGYEVCMARRPRNLDKLEAIAQQIRANGGKAHALGVDARDEAEVKEMFARIERDIGPLDFVLFNVGGNVRFALHETTERVFRKVWQMCAYAGFLAGREAAAYMVPRGTGSIFFTGATASVTGRQGYAAFASGKFALRGLAQAMARELGPQGIHVAHLVIDAGVDTAWVRERMREAGRDPDEMPPDTLMQPASIAEAYWSLHCQNPDGWTHELDIRPYGEQW